MHITKFFTAVAAATLAACAVETRESSGATITATYSDAPAPAMASFEEAMDIWSRCLETDAPIKIHVQWIQRGPTGFALPNGVRNLPHLPVADVWYPTALANALAGARANDSDDMNIFLSDNVNWHYGDDQSIAPDQVDFVNVALHEIAHGIGVSSATFVPWDGNGEASIGLPNPFVDFFTYTFAIPTLDGTPTVYDSKIRLGDGKSILSFENESAELTAALNDKTLFFDGNAAIRANDGNRVYVTPGNITHIPAPADRPTPIMLADSGRGESIRTPDPILLGMLADLGWRISERCLE